MRHVPARPYVRVAWQRPAAVGARTRAAPQACAPLVVVSGAITSPPLQTVDTIVSAQALCGRSWLVPPPPQAAVPTSAVATVNRSPAVAGAPHRMARQPACASLDLRLDLRRQCRLSVRPAFLDIGITAGSPVLPSPQAAVRTTAAAAVNRSLAVAGAPHPIPRQLARASLELHLDRCRQCRLSVRPAIPDIGIITLPAPGDPVAQAAGDPVEAARVELRPCLSRAAPRSLRHMHAQHRLAARLASPPHLFLCVPLPARS